MSHAQQNTGPGSIEPQRGSAPRLDGEGSAGINAAATSAPLISTLREIEAIERIPLSERALPSSTYEMLRFGAARNPDAPALSFFARATDHLSPLVWTHAE